MTCFSPLNIMAYYTYMGADELHKKQMHEQHKQQNTIFSAISKQFSDATRSLEERARVYTNANNAARESAFGGGPLSHTQSDNTFVPQVHLQINKTNNLPTERPNVNLQILEYFIDLAMFSYLLQVCSELDRQLPAQLQAKPPHPNQAESREQACTRLVQGWALARSLCAVSHQEVAPTQPRELARPRRHP